MRKKIILSFTLVLCIIILVSFKKLTYKNNETIQWIRINQLGYTPTGIKVAVWCNLENGSIENFSLIDSASGKKVFTQKSGKSFGAYGPFNNSARLNFSSFKKSGTYYLEAGKARSPFFRIHPDVYKGAADFCLFYMRQQRCGYNPFLKDSCHTQDGYTLYGPMPDSSKIDVIGGWHDASDYLQYATTSANATWHLLAAYRDFPHIFLDQKLANGLDGKNGIPDVLDEAKWGLDWLLKMHPKEDWMFNQIADDRDHVNMRIPRLDSFYGRGNERPVYFINGAPQQRGKFMNATQGTSSTAAKFASAFALGSSLFQDVQFDFSHNLYNHSLSSLNYANKKPGVTQTVSVKSPYIYAEENWTDDMELAYTSVYSLQKNRNPKLKHFSYLDSAFYFSEQEKITPWMKTDTAHHYQYYPFINLGHYELAKLSSGERKKQLIQNYREGIESVWKRAQENAFYRGVPFIWCSNNLTTSFAIQTYWYRQLSQDRTFEELEQANIDWLFGCNPWGTSMVYGLPSWGDTPTDPHSAFTKIGGFPIYGGLIDGPVYTSIFKGLIGIQLYNHDTYSKFQSSLAVYHDDYGDYSTNEPTMDGTASLIYLLAAREAGK